MKPKFYNALSSAILVLALHFFISKIRAMNLFEANQAYRERAEWFDSTIDSLRRADMYRRGVDVSVITFAIGFWNEMMAIDEGFEDEGYGSCSPHVTRGQHFADVPGVLKRLGRRNGVPNNRRRVAKFRGETEYCLAGDDPDQVG